MAEGTRVESCCLFFWRTAAQKKRNTGETGSEAINLQKTCEQSKPKARQLVRLSHHCLWSCRLLRFAWSVIFLNRKLTLPPFSQRLNQDGAMWSLPGVSAIPILDIQDTKIKLSLLLNLILNVSISICALCWWVNVIFFPYWVSEVVISQAEKISTAWGEVEIRFPESSGLFHSLR